MQIMVTAQLDRNSRMQSDSSMLVQLLNVPIQNPKYDGNIALVYKLHINYLSSMKIMVTAQLDRNSRMQSDSAMLIKLLNVPIRIPKYDGNEALDYKLHMKIIFRHIKIMKTAQLEIMPECNTVCECAIQIQKYDGNEALDYKLHMKIIFQCNTVCECAIQIQKYDGNEALDYKLHMKIILRHIKIMETAQLDRNSRMQSGPSMLVQLLNVPIQNSKYDGNEALDYKLHMEIIFPFECTIQNPKYDGNEALDYKLHMKIIFRHIKIMETAQLDRNSRMQSGPSMLVQLLNVPIQNSKYDGNEALTYKLHMKIIFRHIKIMKTAQLDRNMKCLTIAVA
uniref:Uncharacterized protein n=1 Tax=Tetranychus urticae TaxID=32264 RepID=T1KC00_TETUR